jgi:hypothetical protein
MSPSNRAKKGTDRSMRVAEELASAPAKFGSALPSPRRVDTAPGRLRQPWNFENEAAMPVEVCPDDLKSAVRHALLTTRAAAVCPFHPDVTIRIGDDAAETHAFYRTRNLVKSDGTGWKHPVLMEEIARQLDDAADGACPRCVGESHV